MNGLTLSRSSLACLAHTSISYALPSKENGTVSSPSTAPSCGRSQTTVTFTFCAIRDSPSPRANSFRVPNLYPDSADDNSNHTSNLANTCRQRRLLPVWKTVVTLRNQALGEVDAESSAVWMMQRSARLPAIRSRMPEGATTPWRNCPQNLRPHRRYVAARASGHAHPR